MYVYVKCISLLCLQWKAVIIRSRTNAVLKRPRFHVTGGVCLVHDRLIILEWLFCKLSICFEGST